VDTILKGGIAGFVVGLLLAATVAYAANTAFIGSFTQAEQQGLIDGDPAYYYNGQAQPVEYAHAIMTALLRLDVKTNGCPEGTTETGYGDGALYVPNLPARYTYYLAYNNDQIVRVWGPYPAPGQYPRGYDSYGVCYQP